MRLPNLLASRRGRLLAFFLLYITEGIPLGFGATAIATQLRRQGVGPAEIGVFVGSFYLPWAFKWAFGPLIDTFGSVRLGRRRGWILFTQIAMALTLLATMGLELPAQLGLFTAILLVHNSFGAMQDVAIDALAVGTLAEDERGLANGLMFGGAALGQAVGGTGVLFLMPVIGFQASFVFVAASLLAVTVFVVLPLREAPTAAVGAALEGAVGAGSPLRRALGQMRDFSIASFRSFLGTRGAFAGLLFSLLPPGAMCLSLSLQSNLAVELGLDDDAVGWLALATQVVAAASMVLGGALSDRFGRRRTLALYIASMSLPVFWLAHVLAQQGWVMPAAAGAATREVPPVLVTALWVATLTYNVGLGLMFGTRSAAMMDVTNPAVAATQFTAYMALANLATAYSATWQGIAIEAFGYPLTMQIDAVFGMLCLAVLPLVRGPARADGDGRAPARARGLAGLLALGCLAWVPYRMSGLPAGASAPIFDTLFGLIFVGSALMLLAAGPVAGAAKRGLLRAAPLAAGLLFAVFLRRWFPDPATLWLVLPLPAALVLGGIAWRGQPGLQPAAVPG